MSETSNAPTLNLLIGPVGAGKSTFGYKRAAATRSLFFDLDSWMVRLFGADTRPADDVMRWYLERRDRCRALLWDVTFDTLRCGVGVYLELGLLSEGERNAAYERVRGEDMPLAVWLLDAPRDVRRERVVRRNTDAGPYTQVVPLEFFERASEAWQPVTDIERKSYQVRDV